MAAVRPSHSLSDVLDRARANLNDSQNSLWHDELLVPHTRNAYTWAFNQITKYNPVTFKKIVGQPYSADLVYVANSSDQTAIVPADLYLPLDLEFRVTTAEEWTKLDRVNTLNFSLTQPIDRVVNWEWRNRTIFVSPGTSSGLFRLSYISLLPDEPSVANENSQYQIQDSASLIHMDNVVEALGYYTAADAYARRGQKDQAAIMKQSAQEFMDQILDHIVLNMQLISTRGQRFGGSFIIPTVSTTQT